MVRRKQNADAQTKAIAYLRVSTQEQSDHGHSLEVQEARLRAYCTSKGLQLVEIVLDPGVSGGSPLCERPGGRTLLDRIRSGQVAHIVSVRLDRLFRSALDCLQNVQEWEESHVHLHLLDMDVDTSKAQGKMFLTMAAAFAELERAMVRERTATTLAGMRAQGKVTNHPPFGYRRVGDQLVPLDSEQFVIQHMLELHRPPYCFNYNQIANRLNEEGYTQRNDAKWHRQQVQRIIEREDKSG